MQFKQYLPIVFKAGLPHLVALLFFVSANAADVRLMWDAKPAAETWTAVRIYERVGAAAPFTFNKVAEVAGTEVQATITNVTPGVHTYVARAVNVWESGDSNAVSTPVAPLPPNMKMSVTVIVP